MTKTLHTGHEVGVGTDRSEISLSELKSRRTPVEWFEGIAVVQELCRAMLESGIGEQTASFGPDDVIIGQTGSVRVAAHNDGEDESTVRQVGELLQLILANSSFPVPLRLVITQSTSTPPFYASISDLAGALEYFERPDRPGLIRSVFERAQKLSPVQEGEAGAETDHKKRAPQTKKPDVKHNPKRQPLPKGLIYATAAAVAAIVVGVGAATWSSGSAPYVTLLANLETGEAEPSARGESGSGRANPATAPASSGELSVKGTGAAPSPVTRAPQLSRHVEARTAMELTTADQPQLASDALVPGVSGTDDAAAENNTADTAIYSATDGDVTPPIATYPRLPAVPPSDVRANAVSTLELLVNETGEVESVRLRGRPSHLAEALLATMNLSAAKTWRFAPAVKEGRPVKYRKLVHVRLTAP